MTAAAPATGTPGPMFAVTSEREALRNLLREFFSQQDPGPGWGDLLDGIGADEIVFGGAHSESTPVDLAILAEEAGAALFGGPLVPSVALGVFAAAVGDEALVAGLRGGTRTAAAVLGAAPGLCATHADGSVRVGGVTGPVWGNSDPALLLTAIECDGQPGLALLDSFEHTALPGLDLSRPVGRTACDDSRVRAFLQGTPAADAVAAIERTVGLTLAAELLGVSQHALDATVEYVAQRVQFGRTIGSFQAIKHRLADLLGMVELSRSAVYAAAWGLAHAPGNVQTDIDLAVAAALSRETALSVTKAAVQLHGGIAITWEHWAHRYLRRAHAVVALTGPPAKYRHLLASLIDIRDGQCD